MHKNPHHIREWGLKVKNGLFLNHVLRCFSQTEKMKNQKS